MNRDESGKTVKNRVMLPDDPVAYPPDSTFWRIPLHHFSPFDFNWPIYAPMDAMDPNPNAEPSVDEQCDKDCLSNVSSYVEERSRIFHEDIPIPGLGAYLHYASNRTPGYKTVISVPASGETVPDNLKRIRVRVEAAGRIFERELESLADRITEFDWDGRDHLGREVASTITLKVGVGYVYDGFFRLPSDKDPSFGQAGRPGQMIPAREDATLWKWSAIPLRVNHGQLAEGWTLSSHHHIDPLHPNILYKGDGSTVRKTASVIETIAGTGPPDSPGRRRAATGQALNRPALAALDPTGAIYIEK